MHKIKLMVVLLFLTGGVFSQTDFKNKVYRRTSKVIEKDFPKPNPFNEGQLLRTKLLFSVYELQCIGAYKNSLSKFDQAGSPHFSFFDSVNNYKTAMDYDPLDAKKYILEKAKNNQFVIINENHDQPMHRIFAASLLKELYDEGYHYFAVEALTSDSSLNQKQKPTFDDGYYTTEPQFANMLKLASEIGYTFVAYEATNEQELKKRDYYQALHIKEKTVDKDPTAKVFIYCGFEHNDETVAADSLSMMAAWLKLITRIDPLTVDQVFLTEGSNRDCEHTSYSFLHADKDAVFVNKKDSTTSFVPFDKTTACDVYVYHPRSVFKNNRPAWLATNGRQEFFLNKKNIHIAYPLLVMAYERNENVNLNIPTDAIELKNASAVIPLYLKEGDYKLVLRNDLKQEQVIMIHAGCEGADKVESQKNTNLLIAEKNAVSTDIKKISTSIILSKSETQFFKVNGKYDYSGANILAYMIDSTNNTIRYCSYSVMAASYYFLDSIADFLIKNKAFTLCIYGYADAGITGLEKKNELRSSDAIALVVEKYLLEKKVSKTQLKTKGMGKLELLYPTPKNKQEHEKNNRVKLVFTNGY
ncbi:MAG: hypothetical protein JWP12_515 [Bacteroidetes bacterium]|nr:hypothetical protein [Bacteroidota bacterium]